MTGMVQTPLSLVAVLVSGAESESASKSSTATPAAGDPSVSSLTVPPRVEVPVLESDCWAAATWMARSRSAAETPTSLDRAMVITMAKTVTASSRLSSEITPRASRAFCSIEPVASGSIFGGTGTMRPG